MLTKEQNDLLCRVEGDAADGAAHAPPLAAGLHVRGGRRAATARRCARACSARTWWFSATRKGAWACSASTACTAARRSPSAATRTAACAASITAGSSTSTATSSTCRRSRAGPPRVSARRRGPIRCAKAAVSSGRGWARPERCPNSSRPPGRRTGTPASAIVKMHVACNWAQVLEGSIDSAHSSSLHSTNMPSAEVEGSTATDSAWLRPSTDKAPRMQFQATSYGFRYAAIRKPIRNPETAPLRPHHAVRRAVHRAHPAERPVQPRADAGADRRREHDVLLGRLAPRSGRASRRTRGARSAARGRGSISTRTGARSATSRTVSCRIARR